MFYRALLGCISSELLVLVLGQVCNAPAAGTQDLPRLELVCSQDTQIGLGQEQTRRLGVGPKQGGEVHAVVDMGRAVGKGLIPVFNWGRCTCLEGLEMSDCLVSAGSEWRIWGLFVAHCEGKLDAAVGEVAVEIPLHVSAEGALLLWGPGCEVALDNPQSVRGVVSSGNRGKGGAERAQVRTCRADPWRL